MINVLLSWKEPYRKSDQSNLPSRDGTYASHPGPPLLHQQLFYPPSPFEILLIFRGGLGHDPPLKISFPLEILII
jgi:hypothetical protein